FDLQLQERVDETPVPSWYPREQIDPNGYSAKLAQLGQKGITDTSRFLSKRNLIIFSDLWERIDSLPTESRNAARSILTATFTVLSERQGYFGGGGGMSGNLYMPIVRMEKNPYDCLMRKLKSFEASE